MFKTQVEPQTDREEFSLQSFQLLKHFFGPRTWREKHNTKISEASGQCVRPMFIISRRKIAPNAVDYGFLPLQRINICILLLLKRHLGPSASVSSKCQGSLHNRVVEFSGLTLLLRPFFSFVRTCELLIWSALEKTELKEWKSSTKNTTVFVNVLFCIFLIVTVIMLVNVLVALLTKTYDNITVIQILISQKEQQLSKLALYTGLA